ncbi:hypothetical protein BDN67DRAFT_972944 [Paxillus ammoniavirescens]|nr:hypothetical protein BDN67DRAFT_972944 [Paxillus ammoniavirescens]
MASQGSCSPHGAYQLGPCMWSCTTCADSRSESIAILCDIAVCPSAVNLARVLPPDFEVRYHHAQI